MTGFIAVLRREMLSLWVTPLAWVLLFVFLLLQGASFYQIVLHYSTFTSLSIDQGPVQAYFGQSFFLILSLVLICPALTMRSFAEERRSGSIEALLTAPVTPTAVVMGKYVATLLTFLLMWLPTLLYVLVLRNTGEVDWMVVAASYTGILSIGAGYLAVGLLSSALTRSQLVAMMLSTMVIFGLLILGVGERMLGEGALREVCAHVSVLSQIDDFSKGIIDLRRLVFDLGLVTLPLYVTVHVVDAWRWS